MEHVWKLGIEPEDMETSKIKLELEERMLYLMEKTGMNKFEACEFISSVMNLGIASKIDWNRRYHPEILNKVE